MEMLRSFRGDKHEFCLAVKRCEANDRINGRLLANLPLFFHCTCLSKFCDVC